jgi:peptidoglycan hydrolase-like protein with peptidoglycan-binding domain
VVTQVLTQIESIQTQLAALEAQVNAGSGSGMGTNAGAAAGVASASAPYNFTELLTTGSQDAQVTALQQELTSLGFYSGPVTGYYGTLTQQAVTAYQTAHGIAATGYTGPSTRAALNTGK